MGRMISVTNRHGEAIASVNEWRARAAPASEKHWKDGRSAQELAKAWVDGSGPVDLARLLDRQPATAGLEITSAIAEAQVGFDAFPGGKRNHDLLVRGRSTDGGVVIGLEAKADEPFGETVAEFQAAALARRESGESTNAPERLVGLAQDIAGVSPELVPSLGALRYQLFSGIAGTLAAVEGDASAAFVVHEFRDRTDDRREARGEQAGISASSPRPCWARPRQTETGGCSARSMCPPSGGGTSPLYVGHLTSYHERA